MLPALPLLAAACIVALLPRRAGQLVLLAAPFAGAAVLYALAPDQTISLTVFTFDLEPLRADRLARAFGWIFLLAMFIAGLFGWSTMGRGERIAALVYGGSALGVVFAGDLITLFVFWEMKAVASGFLIWLRRTPRSAAAGMRYLLVHVAGGSILLGGIVWQLTATGSLEFVAFGADQPWRWLVLVGFLIAAALPPLHAWITDAYPESTIAGTVFLSAFTTKAAVYTLARGFPGTELLVWAGVAMALYGVVYAVLENDIRRLLVYHIISQVGYMVAAVGVGTETAINGATAHAFAHILYKGLLLMGAGAVLYATGRSKLTELGGLARHMPWVAGLYMIGAFSISGFPLFSGFVSKELAVSAASLDGRYAMEYLLKLASVGTFLHTGLKLPYFTWWGPDRGIRPTSPVPFTMLAAMGLAAAANIAIGVMPSLLYDLLPFPVEYVPYSAQKVIEAFQLLAFTALGFWLLLHKLGGEPTITLDTDWVYRRLPSLVGHRLAPVPAALRDLPRPAERLTRVLEGAPRRLGAVLPRTTTGSRPTNLPTWWLGLVVLATFVLILTVGYLL
jgi:multicomponent Na+:H+ antiporter subunit D